ncbi:MAG: 50S ribosomal protein L15 [Acidobacteriota bacterium]|nr:50S ribosomal protein L15 [Acidobacteriota bacterium]MDQ7088436.1 50S ribosomal protein L15 [Acidobacteriota bacterium]
MRLHDIGPAPGSRKKRKRIGRGPGSGTGKTAGRGEKGQKSRSGYSRRWGFEGGQMPLVRRVPKRGFTNIFREDYAEVNVGRLGRFDSGAEVTPEALVDKGLLRRSETLRIKLLGKGEIDRPLTVHVHKVSAGARSKIEGAGGKVVIIGGEAAES